MYTCWKQLSMRHVEQLGLVLLSFPPWEIGTEYWRFSTPSPELQDLVLLLCLGPSAPLGRCVLRTGRSRPSRLSWLLCCNDLSMSQIPILNESARIKHVLEAAVYASRRAAGPGAAVVRPLGMYVLSTACSGPCFLSRLLCYTDSLRLQILV